MGVTRLKRKGRRNKQRSAQRVNRIKQLTATPVLKNVDKEELIASFETNEPKKAAKAKKEEAPKAETKKEEAPEAKAEKKESAPKAKKAKKEEAPAEEVESKEEASDKE